MSALTFKDLFEFVLQNKGTTTFMGMSDSRIAQLLADGLRDNLCYYAVDGNDNVVGMILAETRKEQQVLFVTENLAMNLANLRRFAAKAKEQFPGLKLEAIRHGQLRQFNTDKIYNKLATI